MYHQGVLACVVCVLLCQILACVAAPAGLSHGDTRLSLVLRGDTDQATDEHAGALSEALFGGRSRRSVPTLGEESGIDLTLEGEDISASESRNRRSAAWWMHAVVQLCNNNRHMCRRIEVEEGNLHYRIRLEDA